MKHEKLFWLLIAGIVGGFAFAAGGSLWTKTESKLRIGETTAGADSVGAGTQTTTGVQ